MHGKSSVERERNRFKSTQRSSDRKDTQRQDSVCPMRSRKRSGVNSDEVLLGRSPAQDSAPSTVTPGQGFQTGDSAARRRPRAILTVDLGMNGVPDECVITLCPNDLDGSGDVGFSDLLQLLSVWGPCTGCPEDLDGSGAVDFSDLLEILSSFGACP